MYKALITATLILVASLVVAQSNHIALRWESDPSSEYTIYRGFVIKYDCENKIPKHALHRVTPDQTSPNGRERVKRRSRCYVDHIALACESAADAEYKGSGFDRGHLVPAGDFCCDRVLKDETFVLTNIAPQDSSLNRGIWKKLENWIRRRIREWDVDAYVITGTIVEDCEGLPLGRGGVAVPCHFFKLVYFPDSSAMYAFRADNRVGEYSTLSLPSLQVRVDDIEDATKEDFFDLVPDSLEHKLESTIMDID